MAGRKDVDPSRIVYFGESLGAAVALRLATERSPLALVLRSPYLLSIAAIVGLYEIASTVMDFQFTSTVAHFLDGDRQGHKLHAIAKDNSTFDGMNGVVSARLGARHLKRGAYDERWCGNRREPVDSCSTEPILHHAPARSFANTAPYAGPL